MLVTFGICFKEHFDSRYLVFCNLSPPRMFLPLDLLSEYRIQHDAIGLLYVTSSYSTWIFCRGVSGFATDCPCSVWCRGLTTCLLHVGLPFGNQLLTHWGRDKMDAISQTTFSKAFSWMKMKEFRLGFHWSLFLRFELTIFQHWFR